MSNRIKFWLRDALYSAALLFFGGTLTQTFMLRLGIPAGPVGVAMTLINAVNLAVTMVFAGRADTGGDTIKSITRLMLPIGVCYLGYIPLCLITPTPAVAFAAVLIPALSQSFFIALRTVFEYKLPYRIIPIDDYGMLIAADGVITGITGIGAGALISRLFIVLPFYTVMLWGFASAALLTVAAALINGSMKPIDNPDNPRQAVPASAKLRALIAYPLFGRLIPANFVRGIPAGIFGMTAVIAIGTGSLTDAQTPALVMALSAANLAGSLFFAPASGRIDSRTLCLIGSVAMLPFAFITAAQKNLFIILYFIVCAGKLIFDYAVPTALYRLVPYEIAGAYHAWRLILTGAGTALAATLTGYLIAHIPAYILTGFAAVCQLYSGWVYFASPLLRDNKTKRYTKPSNRKKR